MTSINEIIHQQEYWPLQVIQEEYACALDIPLRIYNLSAGEKFWEEISKDSAFNERFPNKTEFHNYVVEVANEPLSKKLKADEEIWNKFFTKKIEKSCWLTEQSSGYCFIHSFQESPLWRWWEFFFYYNQFVIEKKSDNTAIDFNCIKKPYLHIAFEPISFLGQPKCVLIAGPVWTKTDTITGSDFEEQRVKPLVEEVLKIICSQITTREHALVRMGNNRFPMGTEYLYERLKRAVSCFKQVLKTSLPVNANMIHRCDYTKLAEWSLFTLQLHKRLSCDILSKLKNGQVVYARLDHPSILEEKEPSPWVKTQWDYSNDQLIPSFKIQYEEPDKKNRINSLHIELHKEFDESCKQNFENTFTTFQNRIFTRKSARRNGALLTLRKWLNDRFRIIAKEQDKIDTYEWLCGWVADYTAAAQVTLYYYNHGTRLVKKIGFYGRTNESKQWENSIEDYMKSAGKDEQQRKDSICYRCIDKCKVMFTRRFDPKNKTAVPENELILLPPTGIERSNQSAIATPIFVYGRVWGVLEINGLYPYQFCWSNKTFIEELASIFSPFFYQQHLLDRLHKLNKNNLEHPSSEAICKNIAHQLAVIFLSYSATLFIGHDNQYKCVGWSNRPDIDQHLLETGKNEWNSTIDKKIINEAIEYIKTNKVPRYQIEEESKHICVIPVYARDEKLIGSIILYNQTNEGFDERWFHKITIVSRHVALILEAMQLEQKREKLKKDFIAHEIKQNATLISDRATSLKNYVNYHFRSNDKQKHRMHLLTYDLETYTNDLVEDINWFSSDSDMPKKNIILSKVLETFNQDIEFLNFREIFNIEARSHWQIQKKKGFDIDYDYEGLDYQEPYIKMHGSNLRRILRNLLNNAVKYTLLDLLPSIEAKLIHTKYGLKFIIINSAPCLQEGEENRLFDENFRGEFAKENNIEGQGKGLFIVKSICDLYNIGIYYDSEPNPITKVGCLHTFTLSFPPRLVKKRRR